MKNTLLVLLVLTQTVSVAMAQSVEEPKSNQVDTLSVGATTRAWLEEQGSETNRAPTEPFAAQRAAQAVVKYLSGSDTPVLPTSSGSFKATSTNATGSTR